MTGKYQYPSSCMTIRMCVASTWPNETDVVVIYGYALVPASLRPVATGVKFAPSLDTSMSKPLAV